MIGEADTTPIIITVTIGGVALVTIAGLVVKYLMDRKRKNGGGKDAD